MNGPIKSLRNLISATSLTEAAKTLGFSKSTLCEIANGKHNMTQGVADKLGWRLEKRWIRKQGGSDVRKS